MLQDEELGSDSSDEDYKPGGESEVSEEEGEGVPEEADAQDEPGAKAAPKGKRKKKQTTNPRKKKMLVLEGEEETAASEKDVENEELKKEIEEERQRKKVEDEKKKADDLFADFMKDVSRPKPRPKPAAGGGLGSLMSTAAGSGGAALSKPAPPAQPAKVTVTKVFDFAGESVTVTKDVDAGSREAKQAAVGGTSASRSAPKVAAPARPGGLAGLVKNLGKAPKMSVLEKSKLDWNGFKKEENLEEELEQHKRSNNSFIEKQEFLQRADVRQFELEKAVRDRHRTPR